MLIYVNIQNEDRSVETRIIIKPSVPVCSIKKAAFAFLNNKTLSGYGA